MLELIAEYTDGAGAWRVFRDGDTLTVYTANRETLTYALTRASGLDAPYWPEFKITDRFAACDDYGANGVVWIDGDAYTLKAAQS